jgi:hypothetical protein
LFARKTKLIGLNGRNLDLSVKKLIGWEDRLAKLKKRGVFFAKPPSQGGFDLAVAGLTWPDGFDPSDQDPTTQVARGRGRRRAAAHGG